MANYPEQLPLPARDGYSGAMPQQRIRFQMDDDTFRDIRRWGSQPFRYTLTWRLQSYEHAQIFEAWVEYTLNAGESWVDIPLGYKTVTVRAVDGKPTFTPVGAGWNVSMAFDELRGKPAPYQGMANWPVTLPVFDKRDFQLVPSQGPAYSDIQQGLPEVRRRFKTRSSVYSGKILFDTQQLSQFWDFYKDRLQDGVAYFMAPFASPLGETFVRARISSTPTEVPEGSHFWLSMQLETFEAPILTKNEYLEMVSTFFDDYFQSGYIEPEYIGTIVIGV